MQNTSLLTSPPEPKIAAGSKLSALPVHALAACWLGMVFDGMDTYNFILTLHPALAELLHTSSSSIIGLHGAQILAIFMLGWAIGANIFGLLADRIGRTRTLIISVLMYALFTGLCAFAHTWLEMAIYRFFVACGIGGEISIGGVMLAEIWKGNARLHATSILQSGFPCGYLLLSLINLTIGNFGWRWLYLIGMIPALLAFYMRLKLDDAPDAKRVLNYKNDLRAKQKEQLSKNEIAYLQHPIFELFNKDNLPKTIVAVILGTCASVGTYAVLGWMPAWINQLTGTLAVQTRSYAAISQSIGNIIGSATAGLLILAIGRKWAFRLAFAGSLIVCPLMYLTTKAFGPTLIIWAFLAGGLVLAPYAYLFIYVPELFTTRIRATGFAFCIQSGRVLAGLVCLLSGQLVGLFGGSYAKAGAAVAVIYALGLLATMLMPSSSGQVSEDSALAQ